MDLVFISKILIIIALYLLSKYIYKKTEWHKRGQMEWESPLTKKINKFLINVFNTGLDDLLGFIFALFWGLPLFIICFVLGFIVLFEGTLKLLDSRNYWEQILIYFGFISLYFAIRIYLDGEKLKKIEKDSLIEIHKKIIIDLREKLSLIEKNKISESVK